MFGRRTQDEDPFAALKDGGTYQSQPTTSGVTPAPLTTAPPLSASLGHVQPYGSSRRRSSFGGFGFGWAILLRLLIPVVVIAAIAVPAIHIGHSVSTFSVPSFSTPSAPAPSAPPRPTSYLTPRGLRAGLAHVARVVPGARLTLLRIDGSSLSTTAVFPGGKAKLVYFGPTATMVTATAVPGQVPVPLSEVKPRVVARLVAAMAARFRVPRSRIDYMVISSPPGLAPHWIIFAKGPAHRGYSASLSGAGLARLPG